MTIVAIDLDWALGSWLTKPRGVAHPLTNEQLLQPPPDDCQMCSTINRAE